MQYFWPTNPNIVGCYVLRQFAHPVACCWMLIACCCAKFKTGQTFQPFLLLRDCQSVAQQCWIRLHSSSNIVGVTHAHYAWFTKTYGLYPSHDALQVPTLLGVVASIYTPLPTWTQQLPMLLAQQCWELLCLFAHSLSNICEVVLISLFWSILCPPTDSMNHRICFGFPFNLLGK